MTQIGTNGTTDLRCAPRLPCTRVLRHHDVLTHWLRAEAVRLDARVSSDFLPNNGEVNTERHEHGRPLYSVLEPRLLNGGRLDS